MNTTFDLKPTLFRLVLAVSPLMASWFTLSIATGANTGAMMAKIAHAIRRFPDRS